MPRSSETGRARRRRWRAAGAAVLAMLGCGAGVAAPSALQSVLISRSADTADIEIRFACPNRYLMHSPLAAASRTEISLMRLDRCGGEGDAISEATRPPGRALAALDEVEYTARGGTDAALRLHFDRAVVVTVEQSGDLRSLRLRVQVPAGSVADSAVAGALPLAPVQASRPALTPEQQARADARTIAAAEPPPSVSLYALNLRSATSPIDLAREGAGLAQRDQTLYVADVNVEGMAWHRLRLGFFATEADANDALAALAARGARYPDAWVTRVMPAERAAAGSGTVAADDAAAAVAAPAGRGTEDLTSAAAAELLLQARGAVVAGDFPQAIQLATRVLEEPAGPATVEARELLGLARERNGQAAHAVAEYRRYLEDYPQAEGAERVRQRLAALTTARDRPKESLRGSNVAAARDSTWDAYGGLAQYYRRDSLDFGGGTVDQAMLLSDAELVVRHTGERFDFGARTTLGYDYDMSGEESSAGDQARVYNLYVDLHDRDRGLSSRLGRQTLRNQGVLGRFDGALVSWQAAPAYRLNVLTGFPVYTSDQGVDTARLFYGVSVDRLNLLDLVDVNVYFNIQDVDGLSDRQAIGGEIRYFGENRSLITALDFDLGYSEINSLVALGNWTFDNRTTVNAMFDWRKTPYLTTENALIGQSASTIDELLLSFTEDEIRDLAADRTGSMQTMALGLARPVSERFQVSADVTVSQFDGTPASGGVPGTPDSGTDAWYYVSLIGSSLLREGDVSILGLRYSDGTSAQTTAIFLDMRYPLSQRFRMNPRVLVSQRQIVAGDATELMVRPSLRLLYRMGRNYQLDLDVGGEIGSRDSGADTTDSTSYYLYMGYRADF